MTRTLLCALLLATVPAAAADAPGLKGSWVLSGLAGQTLVTGSTVTLRFDGTRALGSDGCNRYTAPYTASAGALKVGPSAASTRKACPQDLMDQASAFLGALTRANAYRVESGRLQLTADGAVLATFAPQPRSLAGTSWRVTGYDNGKQVFTSVLAGSNLTMEFSADGKAAGSAGCNPYSVPYKAEGEKLSLGPAVTTRKMCAEPERVMEQEQLFLRALETVASARVEGDRLELRTADGALAVTAMKSSK
ncbi:MAG: META domain-containing protein [Acidobacteria bacterium]|nr:META domain-containing protein [Acidobacteriota bacterium]